MKYYFESLDSVRHENSERGKLILPSIEIMTSMLFGQRILVPESYSFDSLGFLEIATDILEARPRYSQKTDLPVWNPFILGYREPYGSFDSNYAFKKMVSDLFKKDTFIASGWKELNYLDRLDFSKYFLEGKYNEIRSIIDSDKVDQLERIDRYFSAAPNFSSQAPSKDLEQYINLFLNAPAEDPNIPVNLWEELGIIKYSLKVLKENKINLQNRSEVRLKGGDLVSPKHLESVLEFIDTFYNIVIADSLRADNASFTTTRFAKYKHIWDAEQIATISASLSVDRSNQTELYLDFSNKSADDLYTVLDPPQLWKKIWEIVASEDWKISLEGVMNSKDSSLERALENHINLISTELGVIGKENFSARMILSNAIQFLGYLGGGALAVQFNLPWWSALPLGYILDKKAIEPIVKTGEDSLVTKVSSLIAKGTIQKSISESIRTSQR